MVSGMGRDVSQKEKIPTTATFKIMMISHTQLLVYTHLTVCFSVVCWDEGWTLWRETSREDGCSFAAALLVVSPVTQGLSFLM